MYLKTAARITITAQNQVRLRVLH